MTFNETVAHLSSWEGRRVTLGFAHAASGDGRIAEITGLTVERVEPLPEDDSEFDGGAVTVSFASPDDEPGGSLVVYRALHHESEDLAGPALRLDLDGVVVFLWDDSLGAEEVPLG